MTENAFIEAFNGRFRAECLSAHWSLTLTDTAERLEAWRRDYNEVWPHGAIDSKALITLINRMTQPARHAGSGRETSAAGAPANG
ncbi:integrase core domain-containing protein [Brevundimonas nasdae]|uniref:integrase core domain-containing protein n=1 Tax=Brevundimonas nasdae TaxID=172043 RepID=UPI003F6920E7